MLRNKGCRVISTRHVLNQKNTSKNFQFPFLRPWRWWRHLKMILSYWACRYRILSIFFQKKTSKVCFSSIFSPPWRWWRHLKMILSYQACQYGNLDTLNSKICPLQQILEIDRKKVRRGSSSSRSRRRIPLLYKRM